MNRIKAFFLGAGAVGAIAFLLFANPPAERLVKEGEQAERWRARAEAAERELDLLRTRLESLPESQQAVSLSSSAAKPRAPTCAPSTPTVSPPVSYPDAWLDPARQEEWNALVSSALENEVERRLGHTLSPERVERLVETLRRLRDASIGLRSEFPDPKDPDSLRDQLAREIMLVESDRIIRAELGIGVSDFLRGLDGNPVEEVFPTKPIEPVR
ncbi:MAG: hypothetical protein LUQ29_11595 [Methylococcaceae bacterium]|nr:hypothetical protein [Methylococcaceae bacterium]